MWSFQEESIKYCKLDCKALYELLTKFNELVFDKFSINIHTVLTLPSLAMRIYKVHYMPENAIYKLYGRIEHAIRQSYTGGPVDVYIPHNKIGGYFGKYFRKLYYYDVNSLYPFVMSKSPMPFGKPTFFEGDIIKIYPKAFGFFYCQITSPDNLNHPLLLQRVRTSNGVRIIAGLGCCDGWICSTEMDNAIKYGYEFIIYKGYQFNTGDLFSKYINVMYELRLQYAKGDPMNLIAKLLMKSLYGKFGMKIDMMKSDIYSLNKNKDKAELYKIIKGIEASNITDIIKFDEKVIIIRPINLINESQDDYVIDGTNVNIAIASTVTANARVHMSMFKNNPKYNLYYTDTDSIVIDKPLHANHVGSKLGQL